MWDEITYPFLNVNGCTIDVPDCEMGPYGFMHYNDVIMSAIASQITSLTIVCSTVYSGTNQGKHQSPASLAFMRGIHRWPVNSQHKGSVTRNMFPFDDVIMGWRNDWVQVIWTNHRQYAVLYRYIYTLKTNLCVYLLKLMAHAVPQMVVICVTQCERMCRYRRFVFHEW